MTKRIDRDPIYRRRHFSIDTIELCVRWYITYRLSYRDLAAMMADREVIVSHTTIMRWVLQYVPEYERKSISMEIRQRCERWSCLPRKMFAGAVWKFVRAAT